MSNQTSKPQRKRNKRGRGGRNWSSRSHKNLKLAKFNASLKPVTSTEYEENKFISSCSSAPVSFLHQELINEDKERLKALAENGSLKKFDLKSACLSLTKLICGIIGSNVAVTNVHVQEEEWIETKIEIDDILLQRSCDVVIVHDDYLCFLCTFSKDLSNKLYEKAIDDCGVNLEISQDAIDGFKRIGNNDSYQTDEQAVWTANLGIGERVQKYSDYFSDYFKKTKSHRGLSSSNNYQSFSLDKVISPYYFDNCLSIFNDKTLSRSDQWYSPRDNGKKVRKPRMSKTRFLMDRKHVKIPYVLQSSLPKSTDSIAISSSNVESNIRTISEWFARNIFLALPYGAFPLIASQNLKLTSNLCKSARPSLHHVFSKQISRILPKGSIGMQLTKPLHDDGNAILSPGVWTSVTDNPEVILTFVTKKMEVDIRCHRRRVCSFYGWIPHKSRTANCDVGPTGKVDKVMRIHHTSYSKPELEHTALFCLSTSRRRLNFINNVKPN